MKNILFYNRSVASSSAIPPIYQGLDLYEVEPRNEEQKKYIDILTLLRLDKIKSIVVLGTVGNGKTMLACSMLNDYINDYPYRARYCTQDNIFDAIHATYGYNAESEAKIVDYFSTIPVLVIDEIKPVNWNETNKNILQKIIVNRHANGLRTVLIGNLTPDQFKQMFDEHIRSRLREGKTIVMTADDMREASII